MRKIYSLVLMAAALLVGTNVQAVNVANQQQLQNAINNCAAGSSVDIVVTENISVATLPIYMLGTKAEGPAMRTINLDLNGKTITSDLTSTFELYKGVLNVKGKGMIQNTNAKGTAIVLHGIYEDYAHWCDVTIGKDASVSSTNYNAITIMEFERLSYYSKGDASKASQEAYDANGAAYHYASSEAEESDSRCPLTTPNEDGNNYWAYHLATEIPFTFDYASTHRIYGTDVTANKDGYRNYVTTTTKSLANGVNLTINGKVYGKKYGVKVNGTLGHVSTYMPNIIVSETAEVSCAADTPDEEKDGTAVYCSGMANYTINGYVHGNIAVVVKSGNVTIEDAVIEGTGNSYTKVVTGGSGMNGGSGCGLIVDTQKGYGGQQNVKIAGDSKISGNSGFAVQEVVVTEGTASAVSAIDIEGGTIVAGDKGAMNFTEETTDGNKVTVYGANVQGDILIDAEEGDLKDLLPKTGDFFVSEIYIDGESTLIVTKGTAPAETPVKISDATDNASIIVAGGNDAISGVKTLGYVEMPNASVVTLNSGAVLKINKLVMGDDAQFVIMPGAKLLVMGEQGIVAGKTSNLVIKADETGMGTFIFNPAVTSNRNPMATVEYYADTYDVYGDKSEYKYNIMVSPFKTISALSAKTSDGKQTEYYWSYQYWNGNAWVVANRTTIINVAQAFQPIALGNSTPSTVSTIYTFQGELQGNVSGEFKLERGYNYMGNGYVAPMDAKNIINEAVKSGKVEASIWIWDFETQNYVSYTLDKLSTMPNMNALNFFVLKATSDVKVDLNYEKLVWDFNK